MRSDDGPHGTSRGWSCLGLGDVNSEAVGVKGLPFFTPPLLTLRELVLDYMKHVFPFHICWQEVKNLSADHLNICAALLPFWQMGGRQLKRHSESDSWSTARLDTCV